MMLKEIGMIFRLSYKISLQNKPQDIYQEMKLDMCSLHLTHSPWPSTILQPVLSQRNKQLLSDHKQILLLDSYTLSWIRNISTASPWTHIQRGSRNCTSHLFTTQLVSNNGLMQSGMEKNSFCTSPAASPLTCIKRHYLQLPRIC